MIEPALFGAKILFLLLLYFFIFRMVRSLTRDLSRGAEPISMPARPASSVPEALPVLEAAEEEPAAVAEAPPLRGDERGRVPQAAEPEVDTNTREFDYLYNKLKPRLVVQHSKVIEDGSVFELKGGSTIGRSEASQIVLPDDFVSSTHARIFARKQFYFLEDLGSTNGTYIDGRRIEGEQQIKPGQEIVIGDTIFRYEE